MPLQPTSLSKVDELVEQGHHHANDSILRLFTSALERDPAADLGDVLQMALRRYPSLRRQAEARLQKQQRKGMHPLARTSSVLTYNPFSSSQGNTRGRRSGHWFEAEGENHSSTSHNFHTPVYHPRTPLTRDIYFIRTHPQFQPT